MTGTVIRFDISNNWPYSVANGDSFIALSKNEENKIKEAKERLKVKNNSELPDEITVIGTQIIVNDLKEIYWSKVGNRLQPNDKEFVLNESVTLEVRANHIEGLWVAS